MMAGTGALKEGSVQERVRLMTSPSCGLPETPASISAILRWVAVGLMIRIFFASLAASLAAALAALAAALAAALTLRASSRSCFLVGFFSFFTFGA